MEYVATSADNLTKRSVGKTMLILPLDADDIFRCILVNEKFFILIKISRNFVPEGPIDNNPALV